MINGYRVRAYGKDEDVIKCRVSKEPFNRVFRGKQRSSDQAEDAYFVNLAYDKPTVVEIIPDCKEINSVEIKPKQFGISHTVKDGKIIFSLDRAMNFTVEVNGIHNMLHFFATKMKPYEKKENDIYFGPGVHYAGFINPKSGQNVYIHPKAYVYGAIFIYKADNVRVYGGGVIDSSLYARGEAAELTEENGLIAKGILDLGLSQKVVNYAGNFVAYECKNLTVEDVIFTDSMFWSFITRNHCKNVVIDNVKLVGQWRYNSDGFDICSSSNVELKNCFIRSFDDCIVVRGAVLEGETEDSRNIRIENNITWCDWGNNLEIWQGEVPNTIKNIEWKNNYLIKMCMIGISVQTWYGSNRTRIKNISYQDIYADNTGETLIPIFQGEDEEEYSVKGHEDFKPTILTINEKMIGKRGKYQKQIDVEDYSDYDLKYSDIEANNVYCDGDALDADIYSYAKCKTLKVENVRLKNVKYDKLKINIPVRNLNIEECENE